jgi:hypothetical protein
LVALETPEELVWTWPIEDEGDGDRGDVEEGPATTEEVMVLIGLSVFAEAVLCRFEGSPVDWIWRGG